MPGRIEFPIRGEKLTLAASVSSTIFDARSPFQRIEILETHSLGRVLLLDGHVQLAELDERAYHESLVHPAALSIGLPLSALVVGGGDGGAIRELRKHASITRIDVAEIDEAVIAACREHLPFLSAGSFEDPRVHLHLGDAFQFAASAARSYDLVIVDSTDVYEDEEGELSEALFTDSFYEELLRLLSPDGLVVTQADNPVFCPYSQEAVLDRFGRVFPRCGSYWALVPSFGGFSGFCWASRGAEIRKDFPSENAVGVDLRYLGATTWALGMAPVPFA